MRLSNPHHIFFAGMAIWAVFWLAVSAVVKLVIHYL